MTETNRKKVHHYVHDDYIAAWRIVEGRIYVLNRLTGNTFEATGTNSVGAEKGFNDFSFDPAVLALLNYTFRDKANAGGPNNAYRTMLAFIAFMKDFDYANKESNLIEDFYGQFEGKIAYALKAVRENHLPPEDLEQEAFDNLVTFYCIQIMRTSKVRKNMLSDLGEVSSDTTPLTKRQTIEYLTILLLVNSLALAADILNRGCRLTFAFTSQSETFINSDAPVILLNTSHLNRIEEHSGCLPLSPRLAMQVDDIGCGGRAQRTRVVTNDAVNALNQMMVENAERSIYFSTMAQRDRFASEVVRSK